MRTTWIFQISSRMTDNTDFLKYLKLLAIWSALIISNMHSLKSSSLNGFFVHRNNTKYFTINNFSHKFFHFVRISILGAELIRLKKIWNDAII